MLPTDLDASPATSVPHCQTGVEGLDDILHGGLAANRLYLLHGLPGTGKTTLALQFLLEGVRRGEAVLHVTLSETRHELDAVAAAHGLSLGGVALVDLSTIEENLGPESQSTLLHPSEVELARTTQLLFDHVSRVKPSRVVIDSLSELRLLAQHALRFRRQILALKTFFAKSGCTVLLLDDKTHEQGQEVESIAHGVVELEQLRPAYGGERRRLSVTKLRGSSFRGGYHDYVIRKGGLVVFPRLVAGEHDPEGKMELAPSNVDSLDELLKGGVDRGTSTLILGPSGAGKSVLATQFAVAAADRGERSLYLTFDESKLTFVTRAAGLGMGVAPHLASGMIEIHQLDPAEVSPGEFCSRVRDAVEKSGCRVVIIDSLNGYLHAMPDERFLIIQLHELLSYLGQKGVVSLLVMAQTGFMGQMQSAVDVTYLADTVVMLRFFEFEGSVKKAISVVKRRGGGHESTIREVRFESGMGIIVGPPLAGFRGVLTGVPTFHGLGDSIMATPSLAQATRDLGFAQDLPASTSQRTRPTPSPEGRPE